MRNLLQYPITEEEVLFAVDNSILCSQKEIALGSTDGYVLNGLRELLARNPHIMEQLLEILKIK